MDMRYKDILTDNLNKINDLINAELDIKDGDEIIDWKWESIIKESEVGEKC